MEAHLINKAQRSVDGSKSKGGSSSKASRKKKKKSPKTQNAGQSTGPSSTSSSSRARSRHAAVADEEEAVAASRGGGGGGDGDGDGLATKCASYTVGAVHVIDIGLGFALLVYGFMVHVPSVTAVAIAYGLILLLGAIAGTLGYYQSDCNKKGTKTSAIMGGLLALLDIAFFIAILVGWESFVTFLNDNKEALMLTEGQVSSIGGLKILFALIFLIGAGLEAHRCMAMWSKEAGGGGGPSKARSPGDSKCSWLLQMCGLQKHKKTDDFVVFDDQASMESSLLWSKNGGGAQATSDDYLEFVPEHERGLASFASALGLPKPEADRTDY